MSLFKKLTLAGVGLAFAIGLSATDASGQRYRRSYDDGSFSVRFGNQPRYYRNYDRGRSYRRYGRYGYRNSGWGNRPDYGYAGYGGNQYGLSWRERRILAFRRAKAIRAVNRYQRTRARVLNRAAYRNSYYYRNW